MYYAIAAGHPAIEQLIELSNSIAEHREPMSMGNAAEVAETLLRSVPGAPEATEYDVIALDAEDRDIHLLLRRKSDGLLARASYIEGEDLADDIDVFEFVSDENKDQVVARFDRWCQFNLEAEDDSAYRALIADMVPIEWSAQHQVQEDLLVIAPALQTLEGQLGMVGTEGLREAISNALASIKAAARAA